MPLDIASRVLARHFSQFIKNMRFVRFEPTALPRMRRELTALPRMRLEPTAEPRMRLEPTALPRNAHELSNGPIKPVV